MRGRLSGRHHGRRRGHSGAVLVAGCGLLLAAGCAAGTAATGPPTERAAGTESAAATTAPSPSPAATSAGGTSPGSSTPEPPAFDGVVVDVAIAAGDVLASDERVIVTLGTVVRLVVTSDIDDEVHVHGVDEYVELSAGQTATHDFTASVPGTFEVELHGSGDLLFTLQIQP